MNKTARYDDPGSDALNSYLRQIGELETLSVVEQQRLCENFESSCEELAALMRRFGFVGSEYLRLVNECLQGAADPADIFWPSSLQTIEASGVLPQFSLWKDEIDTALGKLKKLFDAGKNCSAAREELAQKLRKFGLCSGIVTEQLEIFSGYLRMIEPEFDLHAGNFEPEWTSVSPDLRTLLERKFLMRSDEIPGELQKLAEAVRRQENLRNRIIEANLRLVISVAQKYRNRGVPFGDLIQEGNLGLLRALERFDFKLGYKFSTYASWWIRHNIARIIAEQSRVIRLPGHMIKMIRDISRAEQRFIQLHGREPEISELARALELPEARVSAIRKMAVQTISLQSPVGDEGDGAILEDLIADDGPTSTPTKELARKLLYDRLYAMLRTLPEREQQIIIMRFGFFGQPCLPLTEISRHFHLTRERVRQLEIKILTTLRSPERLQYIDGCDQPDDL